MRLSIRRRLYAEGYHPFASTGPVRSADPRTPDSMQYNLSYGIFTRALLTLLGLGKGSSYVIVGKDHVRVKMGWAFSAEIQRSSILGVHVRTERVLNRGVHGWRGRWLVNGSTEGLVSITLDPIGTARVWPFTVTLKRLTVSVDQPNELVAALQVQ